MAYKKINDLQWFRKTVFDNMFRDKAFDIAKNTKNYGY